MAVSFIDGGNRSAWRMSLSHNIVSNTPRHERCCHYHIFTHVMSELIKTMRNGFKNACREFQKEYKEQYHNRIFKIVGVGRSYFDLWFLELKLKSHIKDVSIFHKEHVIRSIKNSHQNWLSQNANK